MAQLDAHPKIDDIIRDEHDPLLFAWYQKQQETWESRSLIRYLGDLEAEDFVARRKIAIRLANGFKDAAITYLGVRAFLGGDEDFDDIDDLDDPVEREFLRHFANFQHGALPSYSRTNSAASAASVASTSAVSDVSAAVPSHTSEPSDNKLDDVADPVQPQPIPQISSSINENGVIKEKSVTDSDLKPRKVFHMSNTYVAMIGVGDYPKNDLKFGPLPGVVQDYEAMMTCFMGFYNYTFLYKANDNDSKDEIEVLTGETCEKTENIPKQYIYPTNAKIKWTIGEMDAFVTAVKQKVTEDKPDSLIFIVSSHGDSDRVIYDSELDEYPLVSIYGQFWNKETGCPWLADKPKIMIIDACQGGKTPLPQAEKKKTKNLKLKGGNNGDDNKDDNKDENNNEDDNKDDNGGLKDLSAKRLEYENFHFIYGNIDEYTVVDGGNKGGYLIRTVRKVLQRSEAAASPLVILVGFMRDRLLRLVKGDPKNPVRQIINSEECMNYDVYFTRRS